MMTPPFTTLVPADRLRAALCAGQAVTIIDVRFEAFQEHLKARGETTGDTLGHAAKAHLQQYCLAVLREPGIAP